MKRPAATEETPCNLCGARDYVVVGTRDRDGAPLRTVLCKLCGLVWVNPRPSTTDMNAYYETEYRADYKGQRTPALRKIVRGLAGAIERREALQPLIAPDPNAPHNAAGPLRVLDVGCGAGEFVYLLRLEGIDAAGLEPGQEYAGFARDVLKIPIQNAPVDAAVLEPASQDLVTMFHALEHVPDPRRVLTTIRGWLKRGGHLVVEVPNVASTVQAPTHRYHYAHLYHFTASTLGALGEAAGLRLVETRHTEDGGNVIAVFRRDTDEKRPPEGLESAAAGTLATLQQHTELRHYLSLTPYRRAARRLARRLAEDRLLKTLGNVENALRWVADQRKSRLH